MLPPGCSDKVSFVDSGRGSTGQDLQHSQRPAQHVKAQWRRDRPWLPLLAAEMTVRSGDTGDWNCSRTGNR